MKQRFFYRSWYTIIKVTILLLCCTTTSIAQEIPELSPQSPTVGSLGTFGEIPVSLSTGIPNVSIPVYTFEQGDITVPISIDYHASGIRIKDRSGLVGAKWALNAGGQIAVNDISLNASFNKTIDIFDFQRYDDEQKFDFFKNNKQNHFAPESYSYNFLGKSGDVYIDANNTTLYVPKQNKIVIKNLESSNRKIGKVITDEFGITYYFNTKESLTSARRTEKDLNYNAPRIYNTAFFLDKIVSPNGDEVNFEYENNNYIITDDLVNEYEYRTIGYCVGQIEGQLTNLPVQLYNLRNYKSKRIKRIYGTNGEVIFNYTDNIANNDGSGQLQNIIIKNKHKQIKKYNLLYMYNGRYNISKVDILDGTNHKISDYQITYKEGKIPEDFNTRGIDFFGYQNGAGNQSLVPKMRLNNKVYGKADRYANFRHSSKGIIKSIKYPTGGSTHFEFEPNIHDTPIVVSPVEPYEDDGFFFSNNQYPAGRSEIPFTVPENTYYDPNKTGRNTPIYISGFGPDWINGYYTRFLSRFKLIRVDTGKELKAFSGSYSRFNSNYDEYTGSNPADNGGAPSIGGYGFTYYFDLQPGDYKIIMDNNRSTYTLNGQEFQDVILFRANWKIPIDGPTEFEIGGHRIKQLINKDKDGSILTSKTYTYDKGKIFYKPSFYSQKSTFYCGATGGAQCQFYKISSSPVNSIGLNSSGFMAYEKVTESWEGNGSIEHTFDVSTAYGLPHVSDKYAPFKSKTYKANRILQQKYFSENNTLLKQEQYRYLPNYPGAGDYLHAMLLGEAKLFGEFENYFFYGASQICESNQFPYDYSYSFYVISTDYVEPISKTTTLYNDRGQLITTEEYTYDDKFHMLQETKTTDSKNNEVRNVTYFPDDIVMLPGLTSTEISSLNTLNAQHRIAEPIQVDTYKKAENAAEQRISSTRTLYKNWPNNITEIGDVKTSKGQDVYIDKISYHKYDDQGNPLELSKANGAHTIYVWGYHDQYPIAKIENAQYDQITQEQHIAINNAKTRSNQDTDHCRTSNCSEEMLRESLDSLRKAFTTSMVTTYTYDHAIGVTSTTDSRGYTFYHEYDDFNRLKSVRDANGDIISINEYNNSNQ